MDAQRTFSARLTHAWGTLLKQYLIKSECAWSVHWRASNVRQTRSKHIQRACSAHGTYSKRICHTPGTRRASRKLLSMFKIFFIPNVHETRDDFSDIVTYSDVGRTYTKRTQRTRNAFRMSPTCVWRMWNFAIFRHAQRAFHLYANV